MQALCLVGCKAVYPNHAIVIAQELINGGCTRLAMVEAGNQLPNAAPFPARPPPPPPLLYPAQGVSFRSSDSFSDPSGKVENADKCEDGLASEGADQQTTDKLQDKDVRVIFCNIFSLLEVAHLIKTFLNLLHSTWDVICSIFFTRFLVVCSIFTL